MSYRIRKAGVLFALILVLGLVACGKSETKPEAGSSSKSEMLSPETLPSNFMADTENGGASNSATDTPVTAHPSTSSEATNSSSPAESTLNEETTAGTIGFESEDLIFTYKGKTLRVGDSFNDADYEAAWGTPQIEKGQACIGGGFDENYYYGDHLMIFTLGEGDRQKVYDILILEEGFATAKGAVIGQTSREALATLYGAATESAGATESYLLDGMVVSFTFSGGILAEIDYSSAQP